MRSSKQYFTFIDHKIENKLLVIVPVDLFKNDDAYILKQNIS